MASPGSCSSSRRASVVLPAPEGDDKHEHESPALQVPSPSLDVLHLLAQLIDDAFELEPDAARLDVTGLGADGVGLTVELLRQELELAPDRLIALEQLLSRGDVSASSDRAPR